MFDFSPVQIMVVLAIALLIFGPRRLPELGRNLGRGIRDFKSGITGDDDARDDRVLRGVHEADDGDAPERPARAGADDVAVAAQHRAG